MLTRQSNRRKRMGKTRATRKRTFKEEPLVISGLVVMPPEILPWERDLLAVVLRALKESGRADEDRVP